MLKPSFKNKFRRHFSNLWVFVGIVVIVRALPFLVRLFAEKKNLYFRFQINITLIRCFLGHYGERQPFLTSESLIERAPWRILTKESSIKNAPRRILTKESSIIAQTPWPTVTTESPNIEQVPWHNDLLETPSTYKTGNLYEWHYPPPMVSRNPRGHGEMGKKMS